MIKPDGVKRNIIRLLNARGCDVEIFPWDFDFNNLDLKKFNGIVMSPGPGDPKTLLGDIKGLRKCLESLPTLGICLGHQLISLALGAKTKKMFQGHRGANHPVKNLITNKVEITSQNHGFVVEEKSIPKSLMVTHKSLFDGTIAGIRHKNKKIFSVQYHPEASPGPHDSHYLFRDFISLIKENLKNA